MQALEVGAHSSAVQACFLAAVVPWIIEWHVAQAGDVYAFGVLLWQMYTGCQAWAAMSHAQVWSLPGPGSIAISCM